MGRTDGAPAVFSRSLLVRRPTATDQMSDAAAHATIVFAMTTSSVNGTSKASARDRQR
jgi:hypothetical protein